MRVLLDTNVIVDVLQQRDPWFEDGKKIFLLIADNVITGCITAKQAADIHFFSRKQFKGQESVDTKAREVLSKITSLVEVIDTLAVDCFNALGIQNNDYEDAMLIASATREKLDSIVTRNIGHYKSSPVPVHTPVSFLSLIGFPEAIKNQTNHPEPGPDDQGRTFPFTRMNQIQRRRMRCPPSLRFPAPLLAREITKKPCTASLKRQTGAQGIVLVCKHHPGHISLLHPGFVSPRRSHHGEWGLSNGLPNDPCP